MLSYLRDQSQWLQHMSASTEQQKDRQVITNVLENKLNVISASLAELPGTESLKWRLRARHDEVSLIVDYRQSILTLHLGYESYRICSVSIASIFPRKDRDSFNTSSHATRRKQVGSHHCNYHDSICPQHVRSCKWLSRFFLVLITDWNQTVFAMPFFDWNAPQANNIFLFHKLLHTCLPTHKSHCEALS